MTLQQEQLQLLLLLRGRHCFEMQQGGCCPGCGGCLC
jgi:hypothetical protein